MQKKLSIVFCLTMMAMLAVVSCSKEDAYLVVSESQIVFPVEGGEKTITISTNSSWSIIGASWGFTITPASGTGNATVTIKADVNYLLGERTVALVVRTSGVTRPLTLVQGGRLVEETTVHVPTAGGLEKALENYVVENIRNLKISGYLNAKDFEQFQRMFLLTQLDISDCVLDKNEIPEGAFYTDMSHTNNRLEQIKFPLTLRHIRNRAFFNCTSLRMPELPLDLETIGIFAFYNCTSMEGTLILPRSLTTISDAAFMYCTKLSGVLYSSNVEIIGKEAFLGCSKLSGELRLPNIKSIGTYAFKETNYATCRIASITPPTVGSSFLPAGTVVFVPADTRDAYMAVSEWAKYPIVDNEDVITISVGGEAGSLEAGLEALELNKASVSRLALTGTLSVADFGFMRTQMPILMSLNMTEITNTEIPTGAFEGMPNLYEVMLPKNVQSIGVNAFKSCGRLVSISLPASIQSIGDAAFSGCRSLAGTLVLPLSLTSLGKQAFMYCGSLSGELTFPTGLTTLAEESFRECVGLQRLSIPATVTNIDSFAFVQCSGLTVVECASSTPPTLGAEVFYGVVRSQCRLYVPQDAMMMYYSDAKWSVFTQILVR